MLFVFSTTCRICDLNWRSWETLASGLDGAHYNLVYANIGQGLTSKYLSDHPIARTAVFDQLDPRDIVELNLRATPITILLDVDGRVEQVWLGLLDNARLADIRRAIKIGR